MTEPRKDEPAKPAEAPKPAAPAPAPAPAAAAPAPAPKPLSPAEQKRQALLAKEKELAEKLVARTGGKLEVFRDQAQVTVDLAKARDALVCCRRELGFRVLMDVTAVDYLKQDAHPERYCVVWNLLSTDANARLRVRAYVSEDDPRAPSAADLWPASNWGERECYDMFGIKFDGHPDLRRILMPDDFGSYPLRKDYPLRGRGERDNFPVLHRSSTGAR